MSQEPDVIKLEQERIEGEEAKQLLQNRHLREALDDIRSECIESFKKCHAEAHEDRRMMQNQLISVDWLEAKLHEKIDNGHVAAQELSMWQKFKERMTR